MPKLKKTIENSKFNQAPPEIANFPFELLEKIKLQSVKNLALKVKAGKPLSSGDMQALKKIQADLKAGSDSEVVNTIKDVADRMGRTVRTIHYWLAEGMPKRSDGKYSMKAIQEWRMQRDTEFEPDGKQLQWKALYMEMKARLTELEYKKEVGELLPKDEVEQGQVRRVMVIKQALLALPKMIAPQLIGLAPKEIESILRVRLEEIIRQFAKG